MRNTMTETWIYIQYTTAYPYGYGYGYGYPYGYGWGPGFGGGFAVPAPSSWPFIRLYRRSFLRSLLLLLHSSEHPLSISHRNFCQRAGRFIPIAGRTVSLLIASRLNRNAH